VGRPERPHAHIRLLCRVAGWIRAALDQVTILKDPATVHGQPRDDGLLQVLANARAMGPRKRRTDTHRAAPLPTDDGSERMIKSKPRRLERTSNLEVWGVLIASGARHAQLIKNKKFCLWAPGKMREQSLQNLNAVGAPFHKSLSTACPTQAHATSQAGRNRTSTQRRGRPKPPS
jgi:hypothetical protein